ncbi:MAG: YadA C-terminal domain-containing protein [Gammaproteobacteria bacterium]|nr:YadA C-terminal domain-containing protein [Gammaproteobacteria bacterium]
MRAALINFIAIILIIGFIGCVKASNYYSQPDVYVDVTSPDVYVDVTSPDVYVAAPEVTENITVIPSETIVNNVPVYINQPTETYYLDENRLNGIENMFSRGMSAMAAISAIPEVSHHDQGHGHTAVGVGYGHYNGENGVAIGLKHHLEGGVLSGSIGISGSEKVYSVGGTVSF